MAEMAAFNPVIVARARPYAMTFKRITAGTVLLMLVGSGVCAAEQDLAAALLAFDDANRHFQNGDYRAAIAGYERVVEYGYVSGPLFFNKGNAYYRLDQLGQSIRYYERARRFMPRSPELQHNVNIVRVRLGTPISRAPEPFWRPAWRESVRLLGPGGLFATGLFFYVVAAAALAARIRNGPTPWRRRLLTVAAAGAVFFFSLALTASLQQANRAEAVVLITETTLLDEPGGAPSQATIREGLIVTVIREQDNWQEVRLPNGSTGWLRSDTIGEI